jgi:purine-binding chemotaxis protein CheW
METATTKKITAYLLFKLGQETFTFNVKHVINILEMQEITVIPKTPDDFKGISNLRGRVLPVLDLRVKMQMPPIEVKPNTCILVLEIPHHNATLQFGALVDAVTGVHEFQEEEIQAPPAKEMAGNNFIKGIIQQEHHLILVPDIQALFSTSELESIETIHINK